MDFDEYQMLASRTGHRPGTPPSEFVATVAAFGGGTVRVHQPYRDGLANAVFGLVGEAGECYAAPSDAKEAGDLMWYTAETARLVGVDLSSLGSGSSYFDVGDVMFAAAMVAESVKKALFHGKPLDAEAVARRLTVIVRWVALHHFIDRVMEANVEKLRKRWPKGFGVVVDRVCRECGAFDTALAAPHSGGVCTRNNHQVDATYTCDLWSPA